MTSPNDIDRFNLQLPVELKRELEREAERQGRSLAAVVRSGLQQYVEREREATFVAEIREGYERVRARDLAIIERMEGTEHPVEGGQRGESAAGGGVPRERRTEDRVRGGSRAKSSARRRGSG